MKQKINKAFMQNHFVYQSWMYIALLVFATFGWSLIFSVTRYTPPPEKSLTVYFVSGYFTTDKVDETQAQALEFFAQYEQEEVNFYEIDITTYEGQTKYQLMLGAGEGDVFILDKAYLNFFAKDDNSISLDDYIADGTINVDEDDMLRASGTNYMEEEVGEHCYGISTQKLYGMMYDFLFDNRNCMMIVPAYSKNQGNAARLIQWMYDRYYQQDVPDYVDNYDKFMEQMEKYSGSNSNSLYNNSNSFGMNNGMGY